MSGERQLHLIDGWITDDAEQFALYTRGDRPGFSYGAQLGRDVRSWKPWALWLIAGSTLGWGLATGRTVTTVTGLGLFAGYLYMLHAVVRASRGGRLIEAIARFGGPYPRNPLLRLGTFHDPKSDARGETVLEAWAVEKFQRQDGWVPVLISYYPKAQTHPVVGVRPLEWQPPASTAIEGARCARHPEQLANGTCARCGSFVCDYCARAIGSERICSACELKRVVPTPRRLYVALVLAVLLLPVNVVVLQLLKGRSFGPGPGLLLFELVLIFALRSSGRTMLRRAGIQTEPAVSRAVNWVLAIDAVLIFGVLALLRPLLRRLADIHFS